MRDAAGLDHVVALEDFAMFVAETAFQDVGVCRTEVLVHAGHGAGLTVSRMTSRLDASSQ